MNPRKRKAIISNVFVLGFFVTVITIGVVQKCTLDSNHVVGTARIYRCYVGGKGKTGVGTWVDYVFEVNGKTYKGEERYSDLTDLKTDSLQNLRNRQVPILYNPSHPSLSRLLLLPEDFERYRYSFPDSMSWLKPYLIQ